MGSDIGATVILHVQPGAKRSDITGLHADALKIRQSAPSIDGHANAALLQFIVGLFNVPMHQLELKQGG
ncbi:MAG: DUF167 family protein [Gallionella sp.]|nr:DUF167 family protein [Gallionella sp.]